ncbi:MAG: zf-HC2 domain-containing protein [Elusimicrobia bacterium]|nr:zf-HC2 domain-containing protein [Elusimicrobiota bacterium]
MDCKKYMSLLSGYIDNELDNEEINKVNEHLKKCNLCQKELEQLKKIKKVLSCVEKKEPVPFFETRLMARIREIESAPGIIDGFIAVARKVIYVGIGILMIAIGVNMLVSPIDKNFSKELEGYLLQDNSNAGDIKGTAIMNSEISEDEIISLAFSGEV